MSRSLLVVLAMLVGGSESAAQDSLQISSSTPFLSVQTVIAGQEPAPVADSASSYAVSSSTTGQKITARLDTSLPPGTSLAVRFEAPAGATSLGMVTLTTVAQDVVTNLPVGSSSGLRITYQFSGTLAAGVMGASGRSITYSLVPGP